LPNETDRDLLIALIKDVAEVKTEVRAYRALERDVRNLEKKMVAFMTLASIGGGVIVAALQKGLGL
jgi:hypothetical protein